MKINMSALLALHTVPSSTAVSSAFSDFRYFNIGVPRNPNNPFYNQATLVNPDGSAFIDLGLGTQTGDSNDNGKFKTPTLRNIEHTAPYMRDGFVLPAGS